MPRSPIVVTPEMIARASRKSGVPANLLRAVLGQESGGGRMLTSPAGARGPMQLMPGTARGLGVNPDDPWQNLEGGSRYLAQQLKRFGTIPLALSAYNSGPGGSESSGRVEGFPETQGYVKRIMASLRNGGGGSAGPTASPAPAADDDTPDLRGQLAMSLISARRSGDRSQLFPLIAAMREQQEAPEQPGAAPVPGQAPDGGGPGGIDDAFYTPLGYSVDEGKPWDQTISGHDTHGHVSFNDLATALRVMAEARKRGLSVRENPLYDPVEQVHVSGSDHYQTFPGGKVGRAADVSGNKAQLAAFMRWVMSGANR